MCRQSRLGVEALASGGVMALLVLGGCGMSAGGEAGGANFNQQSAGNNDKGGVDLGGTSTGTGGNATTGSDPGGGTAALPTSKVGNGYAEIAVDPTGQYFLTRLSKNLVRGAFASGEITIVPQVIAPDRLAFGWKTTVFYVTSQSQHLLYAIDGTSGAVLWQRGLTSDGDAGTGVMPRLYPSPDDAWLGLAYLRLVEVRDAKTGLVSHSRTLERDIIDVDFKPDSTAFVVTERESHTESGKPETAIHDVPVMGGAAAVTTVPNCASPLVLTAGGTRAFLAPTACAMVQETVQKPVDPVSVINLETHTFVRNLPGFGPVALAADGTTTVAFMDTLRLDSKLFVTSDPQPMPGEPRYQLMLIDAETLAFTLVPIGWALPRYALTKDGQVVLVDFDTGPNGRTGAPPWQGVRILDVATGKLVPIAGPPVQLDHFALSPDSKSVFLISDFDLFRVSIPDQKTALVPTVFACQSLNMSPDGTRLVMTDAYGNVWLQPVGGAELATKLELPKVPL